MTSPSTDSTSTALNPATSTVRGRPLWYDLMTPDTTAAIAFYTAVTGWTLTNWEMGPGTTYSMWTAGGTPIGGSMAMPADQIAAGTPAHWVAYFGTPDADATYALALRLGASSYVAPTDIPTVGRYAVLADPQGAAFAIFTPLSEPGPEPATPDVGAVSWHELTTTDHAAAFDFYEQLFGWAKQDAMDMGPMGVYQMFGRPNGAMYGGMFDKPADMPAPPHWLLYVRVADLDAALERVRAGGGQVLNGPMEVPGGDRVAQCMDPQGGMFGLHGKAAG
jgi:predicted enzyme related to lactoylglutathione lyase